ncbi:hypothetical protein N431DRAFT_421467 [Stipitochalara longipes BDJ]|nr:hypothetical protein N431DRAFT_421467 [Stipitochalara longipes BDJ]
MSDDHEPSTTASPPKYSRYRSVRKAVKKDEPVPEQRAEPAMARTKSMSRYRRTRSVSKIEQVAAPPAPPVPAIPRATPQSLASKPPAQRDTTRRVTEPLPNPQRQQRLSSSNLGRLRLQETDDERMRRMGREAQEREELRHRARKEREEQARIARQQKAEEEAELARIAAEDSATRLAEQKRKDLERLRAELDAAVPTSPPPLTSPRDKLRFFSRKRAQTTTSPPPTVKREAEGALLSTTKSNEAPRGIEQGGGGIVPQLDAPISASNSGERRVLIRCKQSSINLPITPETTPVDIIHSAANIMTQNINPSTAILIESYTQLGLERRIRRYEHIRDVMNSWDRDTQNAFLLENSDTPRFDTDLEASSVPKEVPPPVTVYMYHSQKPGKWNKRYITLLSSGQIFMSKKMGAKASEKDSVSLCHLTDFDIYSLTPQQIRKNLKPPKKHSHAIKSQQRTAIFLNTENFVHFFSTDDAVLSQKWYAAVQQWRSWYLVNKKGEGKADKKAKKVAKLTAEVRPGTRGGPTHSVKVSVDENPYTIGSFAPLMNIERFGSGGDDNSDEESRSRQIPFHLRNSGSLQTRESKRHPPPVSYRLPPEAEEFSSTSLLGRTPSQRQHQKEGDAASNNLSGGVFNAGGLLDGGLGRTSSVKSSRTKRPATSAGPGGGIRREPTQKMPKPLLDFTPQFKEPPQWDKTGKGHGVAAPEGIPLVEAATTPDHPLADIPRATVFRRDQARPATSGEGAFVKGGLVSGQSMMNKGKAVYDS